MRFFKGQIDDQIIPANHVEDLIIIANGYINKTDGKPWEDEEERHIDFKLYFVKENGDLVLLSEDSQMIEKTFGNQIEKFIRNDTGIKWFERW